MQQVQELEQERTKLQDELSQKEVELHDSVGVIVEERERNAVMVAKLAEAERVVEGLRAEVAAKTEALQQKEVDLGEVDQVLKQNEVKLDEKTQVVAYLPRKIEEAREADSSTYLWTTFHKALDTDFRQFGPVALEGRRTRAHWPSEVTLSWRLWSSSPRLVKSKSSIFKALLLLFSLKV